MTKSDAIEILRCRKDGDAAEALEIVLRAAEVQPCEEKTFLKKRTKDYVTYNVEWLKEHFDMEREILLGKAQPCDAVSREAVIGILKNNYRMKALDEIQALPSVQPTTQPCEDAVSRAEVLGYLARTYHSGMGKKKSYEYNLKFVSMMPSVQPIPVMYYPQVTGVTPYVVPDGCGDWVKNGENRNFTADNKTDYEGTKK